MNKETNGSLSPASRKKEFCSNSTNKPFQDMLASFEALVKVEDPVRHEFELIRIARSLKIPIVSYRKMYRNWQKQQEDSHEPS